MKYIGREPTEHIKRIAEWALKQSLMHEKVGGARVCAVLLYKNNVISVGYNTRVSHPIMKRFSENPKKIYLHAEVSAILKARKQYDLTDRRISLIIVRAIYKNGVPEFGISAPCECCSAVIAEEGIRNVYWFE